MKIFDCFTFFNELDLLELRLHELYPVVDHFVLVESDITHSNKSKELLFLANRQRFSPYLDKIIHIQVTDMPRDSQDAWVRENFQRDAILRGLASASGDDLIIISDVDEVPRREVIAELRQNPPDICGLRLRFFSMRLNYMNLFGPEAHVVWPIVLRKSQMASPQQIRNDRYGYELRCGASVIDDAGWHYTSIGDDAVVLNKIRNFAHQEFNTERFLSTVNVARIISNGLDLFGRSDFVWGVVPLSMSCPHLLREQPEQFARLIVPETPQTLQNAFNRLFGEASASVRTARPHHFIEKVAFKLFRIIRRRLRAPENVATSRS